MKIEKKYRIDTESYNITEVKCLIDDDGKLVAAADLDENNFYAKEENEVFFDTEDAARQNVNSVIPTDEEIKKVLNFLRNAPEEKIKEHDETIKTVVRDNSYIYMAIYGQMYDYITENSMKYLDGSIIRRLRLLVRQRILNIDGISVSIDNISHVKWGNDDKVCNLILKDQTEIFCSEKEGNDIWFIKLVFGGNDSDRHFTNLHR